MAGTVWAHMRQRDPVVVRAALVVGVGLLVVGAWLRYFAGLPSGLSWLPPVVLFLPAFLVFVYWSRAYLRWRAFLVSLLLVAIASGGTIVLVRELAYRSITTTGTCTVREVGESVEQGWIARSSSSRGRFRTRVYYHVAWNCGETTLVGTSRHDQGVEVGENREMTYDPGGRLAMRPADDGTALAIPAGMAVGGIWLLVLVRRGEEKVLLAAAERRRLTEEATRRAMETLDNGTTLYRAGNYTQAAEVLNDAVGQFHRLDKFAQHKNRRPAPALIDALYFLGLALAAAGHPRVAVASLETAVVLAARINDTQRHVDAEQELSRVTAQLTNQSPGEERSPDTDQGSQRRRVTTGIPDGTTTSYAGHVFYRMAAKAGDVTAMHRLGRQLHSQGRHVAARDWLRRAASTGYEPSQIALARLYGEEHDR